MADMVAGCKGPESLMVDSAACMMGLRGLRLSPFVRDLCQFETEAERGVRFILHSYKVGKCYNHSLVQRCSQCEIVWVQRSRSLDKREKFSASAVVERDTAACSFHERDHRQRRTFPGSVLPCIW